MDTGYKPYDQALESTAVSVCYRAETLTESNRTEESSS